MILIVRLAYYALEDLDVAVTVPPTINSPCHSVPRIALHSCNILEKEVTSRPPKRAALGSSLPRYGPVSHAPIRLQRANSPALPTQSWNIGTAAVAISWKPSWLSQGKLIHGFTNPTRSEAPHLAIQQVGIGLSAESASRGRVFALKDGLHVVGFSRFKREGASRHKALEPHLLERRADSTEKITVLIALYDSLFRQMLSQFLAVQDDIGTISEAADGSQALAAAEAFQPAILLLGLRMLKDNGVKWLSTLQSKSPKTSWPY